MTYDIPIWQKANLTAEEAESCFNNSINKLRQMTDTKDCERYVLWVGNRRLIKRKAVESYLQNKYSIQVARCAPMCYNNYIIHIDTANAGRKQSDGRCITLYMSCEEEQKTLKAAVPKMQAYPETETDKTVNLQEFCVPV